MQLKMFHYFLLKVSFMILIYEIYWNKFVSESNCHKRTFIDNLLFTFKNNSVLVLSYTSGWQTH